MENVELVSTARPVKVLELIPRQGSAAFQDAECLPALLQALPYLLPRMTELYELRWCKTPSEPELVAMQLLPKLENLIISRCSSVGGHSP